VPLDPATAILTVLAFTAGAALNFVLREIGASREHKRAKELRADERAAEDARAAAERRRALGSLEIDEARRAFLPALEYYAMRAAGATETERLEETRRSIPKNSELVRWTVDTVGDASLVLDALDAMDRWAGMKPTADRAIAEGIIREHAILRRRIVEALRDQERRLVEGRSFETKPSTIADLERATTMVSRPVRLNRDEGVPTLAADEAEG
jgi:hypothetical protein